MAQQDPYKVTFTAVRGIVAGVALVEAKGENRTGGYVTRLEKSPNKIKPPQAQLFNEKPGGIAAQVISGFMVSFNLPIEKDQREVTIIMPEGGFRTVPIG